MHELYDQYTWFSLFVGVLPLLSSSRAGSFADAGMADDGGEGGGDREGKELGEQQLVAVAATVVVPIVVSQKKLLVLDVNGLLVATYYKQETLPPEPYHVKLGNFYVYKRPFCEEFIRFCLENFTVGIWSSAQAFNVNNLVEFVFKDLRHQLAFSWHQTHCTRTAVKHPDNKHKPVFLKELSRLWATFKPGEYGPSNCLLVDDSPHKALKNPPNTAIFPQTYTAHESDDNFLGSTLRQYLEGLRDSVNVQVYVEKNPIGEPSITAASSLWQVYGCLTSVDQPELVNGGENWASNLKLAGSAIVAHGSSRNSYQEPVRTSIPGHQAEEIYSCKEGTHSPRSVERLGKRPKHEWKGILGHSPRTLEDGRWRKQPQSDLDRETQGVDWDYFEENYSALNAYLPCGGGSQLEQEAGQVGCDRAHHYGGELFQPKSLVWIRGLHHTGNGRGHNVSNVPLPPGAGSQVDRKAAQIRWDRAHQYVGEFNQCKRSIQGGGWQYIDDSREFDAPTVPLMPGGELQVDREVDEVRWDEGKYHGGEFHQCKRSVETREDRRDQNAPQGRGWGHHFWHDNGPLNRASPPYRNHRDSRNGTLFQWRHERDLTSDHRSVCSRGQYEQNASVTSLPSQLYRDQWYMESSAQMDQQEVAGGRVDLTGEQKRRDSWRFPANEHQIGGGVIWQVASMEDQMCDGWADCTVEKSGGGGVVSGNPYVEEDWDHQVQDRWANLTMGGCGGCWGDAGRVQDSQAIAAVENRGGGGSWANSSSQEQDGWANFSTTTSGDGASSLDPTSENRVNNWANLANNRFGAKHDSAYASEQGLIGYRNNHYRYNSRPGTDYPARNHYRHESRFNFATQN